LGKRALLSTPQADDGYHEHQDSHRKIVMSGM
jgi:hypothetical protein